AVLHYFEIITVVIASVWHSAARSAASRNLLIRIRAEFLALNSLSLWRAYDARSSQVELDFQL
ncbi:MAG: hypothetical protein AAFR82_06695, partial [Pseudomonadota bacterium]